MGDTVRTPALLVIMDGCGLAPAGPENAVSLAKRPFIDSLNEKYPHTTLGASGEDVGLPAGQMGNSEVGHLNIGAGRIVFQSLSLVNNAIKDGSFKQNEAIVAAMDKVKANGSTLHVMGLVSNGGVHSEMGHAEALLEMAGERGLSRVRIDAFTDGRDVPTQSGAGFMRDLQAFCEKVSEKYGNDTAIATVAGRYYGMDRDNRWDRVEKAYAAFVYGEGEKFADPIAAIQASYDKDVTDEFVLPCITCEGGRVQAGDTIVFTNFRPDRAREITRAFADDAFTGFERKLGRIPVQYVCMAQYDATMPNVEVAYPPVPLTNVLGEYVAAHGKTQLRIAETEKYAHVTFFFNGGREAPFEGEDRCVIPSPKVATYDLQPEMSAYLVADECKKRIESGKYDMIILNFANCDMVGHTGIFDAAVKAVEAVDKAAGEVIDAVVAAGGAVLLTADHGNADKMYEPDGEPFTAHTTNPVPLLAINCGDVKLREGGVLADLAPTLLQLMELPQPEEMTGKSLFV